MQYIITAILLISTFFVSLASAYTLDDTDYSLTTLAEEKLITLAEQQDHRNLSIIIYLLEHIQHEATLSERKEEILAYIIDSIYRHTGYDADGNPYVLNTHDCYEDEYFDEEDQQCYLIDENYTETDTDFGYDTVYIQHEDNQEEILASYITKDTLRLVEGISDAQFIQARKSFSNLFPKRYLDFISQVEFYDNPESETAGFVERHGENAQQRVLTLNIDEVRNGNNTELFIHEMAHIITLESSQLTLETPDDATDRIREQHEVICQTHYTFEGCLQRNAYFYAFVGKFWSEEMLDAVENEEDVYTGYEEDFLTDYAASNPGEDIAESFAFFVTKPKIHGVPGEAGEKIDFFYAYKELVELRAYIRSSLE